MKRSTFLKSLLALSVVPFIPKSEIRENNLIPKDYKRRLRLLTEQPPRLRKYYATNGEQGKYIEFDGVGYFPEDWEYENLKRSIK